MFGSKSHVRGHVGKQTIGWEDMCVFMYVSEGMCYGVVNWTGRHYDDSFRIGVSEPSGFIDNFSNDSLSKKDLLVNRITGCFECTKVSLHLRKSGYLRRNKKHVDKDVAYEGPGKENNRGNS
jgi:hypothetical protein